MEKLQKEMRFLKIYVFVSTLLGVVFVLSAFTLQSGKQKFGEIDAERINIVEKDGQVKLVISNKERIPGPGNIISGKFGKRSGPNAPGILFYNEKGDEDGGLLFESLEQNGEYGAGAGLTFDKYNGSQVIGMQYQDDNGKRKVGFIVWDQPDVSFEAQRKNYEEAKKLKSGAERDRLLQQAVGAQRVFIGRSVDRSSTVTLFDANSRPRLRLSVGSEGDPKLEFLDAEGNVTQTLPASPK